MKLLFHAGDSQREWEIGNRFKSHVNSIFSHESSLFGGSLEIILVPGVIASTVFHYVHPNRPYLSFPVGYTTINAMKVQEITDLIQKHFNLCRGKFASVIPRRNNKFEFVEIFPEFEMIRNIFRAQENKDTELPDNVGLESEPFDDETEGEV